MLIKKEQVKQIQMFCFEEAFLHSHDSKILSDFMTIHIRFSIERQRKNEVKQSKQIAVVSCGAIVISWQRF